MRVTEWITRARKRVVRQEAGFTLIELMSAMIVTTLGVAALVATLDSSRELITFSESKEIAIHVAEQELERIQALSYDQIALADDPVPCNGQGNVDNVCDLNNPAAYVSGGWYRWDQRPWGELCSDTGAPLTHCEQLAIDNVDDPNVAGPDIGAVANTRDGFDQAAPHGGVRLQVEMQRFVTWVDDDCVKTAPAPGTCVGDQDYKRITVAVRILKASSSGREQLMNGGPGRPILLSTVVRDPDETVAG